MSTNKSQSNSVRNAAGKANIDTDDDDEYVWTCAPFSKSNALHQGLHDLESALRCGICGDWYTAPVSIAGCHHTFCSECIRNTIRAGLMGMRRSASCPICREPIVCKGGDYPLVPNRSVEELVSKFSGIRSSLRTTLVQAISSTTARKTAEGDGIVSSATEAAQEPMKSLSSQRSEIHNGGNRARSRRCIAGASSKQDASVNFEDNENSDPVVDQTPSTQDEVVIDLSTAIAKEAGMGGPPASPACRLQKMAKTAYHGLKKKQLQEKCRQCGLSTRGDDKQLKARHQEFVTLYNAECDSFHPRSKEQLIQLVQEREKARKDEVSQAMFNGVADHTKHMKRLKESRKVAGSTVVSDDKSTVASTVISSGNATFDKKFHSNYAKLVADVRRRQQQQKIDKSKAGDENDAGNIVTSSNDENEVEVVTNSKIVIAAATSPQQSLRSPADRYTLKIDDASSSAAKLCKPNASKVATVPAHADKQKNIKSPILPLIPSQKSFKDRKPNSMLSKKSSTADLIVLDDDDTTSGAETCKSHTVAAAASPLVEVKSHPSLQSSNKTSSLSVKTHKRDVSSNSSPTNPYKRPKRNAHTATANKGWNCSACTFFNTTRTWSRARCEVCDVQRTAPLARAT